jgi:hypothetical protein
MPGWRADHRVAATDLSIRMGLTWTQRQAKEMLAADIAHTMGRWTGWSTCQSSTASGLPSHFSYTVGVGPYGRHACVKLNAADYQGPRLSS